MQCHFLSIDQNVDEVLIQGWFGPIGTVSPLHYDSYYNILAQVHGIYIVVFFVLLSIIIHLGYKAVRLYSPTLSAMLVPLDGRMRNNR